MGGMGNKGSKEGGQQTRFRIKYPLRGSSKEDIKVLEW
jgi:hypothetical protein